MKAGVFKTFLVTKDENYKMNDPIIVKISVTMFEAGNNWIARSVLRQIGGSYAKFD